MSGGTEGGGLVGVQRSDSVLVGKQASKQVMRNQGELAVALFANCERTCCKKTLSKSKSKHRTDLTSENFSTDAVRHMWTKEWP